MLHTSSRRPSFRLGALAAFVAPLAIVLAGCGADAVDEEPTESDADALTATPKRIPAKAEARRLGIDHYEGTRAGGRAHFAVKDASQRTLHEVDVTESTHAFRVTSAAKREPLAVRYDAGGFHYTIGERSFTYDGSAPSAEDRALVEPRANEIERIFAALDDLHLSNVVLQDESGTGLEPKVRGGGGWVQGRGAAFTRSWAQRQATQDANNRCTNQYCWGCFQTLAPDCLCAGGMIGGDYGCACRAWGERCGGK